MGNRLVGCNILNTALRGNSEVINSGLARPNAEDTRTHIKRQVGDWNDIQNRRDIQLYNELWKHATRLHIIRKFDSNHSYRLQTTSITRLLTFRRGVAIHSLNET